MKKRIKKKNENRHKRWMKKMYREIKNHYRNSGISSEKFLHPPKFGKSLLNIDFPKFSYQDVIDFQKTKNILDDFFKKL